MIAMFDILALLIVLAIIAVAKLLTAINTDSGSILSIRKQKHSYEEELMEKVDEYIEEVMNNLSNSKELPMFVKMQNVQWNSEYKHRNVVLKETLNHKVSDNKVVVNLHSIDRVSVSNSNRTKDIDIMWKFSRNLSGGKWIVESLYIQEFVE